MHHNRQAGQAPATDFLDAVARCVRWPGSTRVTHQPDPYTQDMTAQDMDYLPQSTNRFLQGIVTGQALVGRIPPAPPTLRARVGANLVRLVQRALFWYTAQIQNFQLNVAQIAREHSEAIARTAANLRRVGIEHDQQVSRLRVDWEQRIAEVRAEGEQRLAAVHAEHQQAFSMFRREQEEMTILLRQEYGDGLAQLRRDLEKSASQIEGLLAKDVFAGDRIEEISAGLVHVATLQAQIAELATSVPRVRELDLALRQNALLLHQMRSQLIVQERRLSMIIEEMRRRSAGVEGARPAVNQDTVGLSDPLYASFEDVFRGSRSDIKERHRVYLPKLHENRVGSASNPVLDIGCGRGEWLELLRDEQIASRGVDVNENMVALCRGFGLDVKESDAIDYLRNLAAQSLGAVTAFHVIEHLPLATLLELIDETVRVLKPGGVAIFETPNPSNLQVAAHTFYMDPTHRNPLPSPLMRFLMEARGLCDIEVLELHPYPDAFRLREATESAEFINLHFFGPQDYTVIAKRA